MEAHKAVPQSTSITDTVWGELQALIQETLTEVVGGKDHWLHFKDLRN